MTNDVETANELHRKLFPSDYVPSYEDAVYYVESAEIVMQRLWGFEYSPDYQTYRFDFIDCTCPRLDNQERRGTGYWAYNTDCPVHKHLCNNR